MSILSTVFSGDALQFVARHALLGLSRAAGRPVRQAPKPARNTQCVKLTKDHENVHRVVAYWCDLRINNLRQQGVDEKQIKDIVAHDARFLTSLAHAVAVQQEEEPPFDAWLFFNEDIQATDFFELQHCPRGSKSAKSFLVLQATC